MVAPTSLSTVFPGGSRLNEHGRLEVGGCDALELAHEFGTPLYAVVEDDLRARARAFLAAGRDAGHEDFHVVFASKAFPCTAVLGLFAEEGLWCDVASAGELFLALNAGFDPAHVVLHGNAKSTEELRMALEHRVGLVVLDNFDEIDRLTALLEEGAADARPAAGAGDGLAADAGAGLAAGAGAGDGLAAGAGAGEGPRAQPVLIRVTPDVSGETHEKISTGQADSKFGFAFSHAADAIARVQASPGLLLLGIHAHVGSQLLTLAPFAREVEELAKLGDFPVWDLGGGLGARYTAHQPDPPSIEEYVNTIISAVHASRIGPHRRVLIEPGRALCANGCVTLYTVESVKQNVSRWVAVDGGMSDNLRPMLYGAPYEAHVADRFGGSTPCVLAGKHCESGDVITREALLDDPRPGDVVVTPATGAYGYAMANNYNGVPRAPVVFCRDGEARLVVRRELHKDLIARDVH